MKSARLSLASRIALVFVLCALGAGCGGREHSFDQPIKLLDAPLALDDQLVLVDQANHHAIVLDLAGGEPDPTPQRFDLPPNPSATFRRNGANEGLVLCDGRRATADEDFAPAALAALDAAGHVRNYSLGNPFDRLVQSDDGRYAVLFKSGTAMRLLDNPNEIAIVDLRKDPAKDKTAVKLLTLTSPGDTPQAVVFSPDMTIQGEQRRLLVVLSNANVTLIDLAHLDRVETTVQLSAGAGQVRPAQVLFNTTSDLPELYVRGEGSSDVFVFTLTERVAETSADGRQHNDFRPTIDQLGVGGKPSDMALYGEGADARVLVVSADTSQAALVDVSTSQVQNVSLPIQTSRVLLFSAESPTDHQTRQRALLYEPNGSTVLFVDLSDLETRGSRNVEEVTLDGAIDQLIPSLDHGQVVVMQSDGGVSLLDLAARTVSPFKTATKLQNPLFDEKGRKLWVAPQNQPYVGLLDLANGDTPEVLLDANVVTLVPMWKRGKVIAMHDSNAGYLTVLDASKPERETAKSLRGYLLAGLLGGGQ